jgi:hypothetical protein
MATERLNMFRAVETQATCAVLQHGEAHTSDGLGVVEGVAGSGLAGDYQSASEEILNALHVR